MFIESEFQIKFTLIDGPPVLLEKYGICVCSASASSHPYLGMDPSPLSAFPIAYLNIIHYSVKFLVKKFQREEAKIDLGYIPNASEPMSYESERCHQ